MQYDNKYDFDHNDCPEYENDVPEEFASDFVVETDYDDYDEFTSTPSEFGSDQTATTDLSDLYENEDVDTDEKPVPYVNPTDEQAATFDDCYCNDRCNCETAQEKCQLDDYEIISDVLGSEKQIVKLYSTALCETAEENLRDIIRENFTEAAADQYKAFSFMQSKGMYKTEQATEEKITEAKQQFASIN